MLLLFGGGVYAGYRLHARYAAHEAARQPKPEAPEEQERRRLIEDQKAFRTMMGYNADVAFGNEAVQKFFSEDGET